MIEVTEVTTTTSNSDLPPEIVISSVVSSNVYVDGGNGQLRTVPINNLQEPIRFTLQVDSNYTKLMNLTTTDCFDGRESPVRGLYQPQCRYYHSVRELWVTDGCVTTGVTET